MKLFLLLMIGVALCFGAVDINRADKNELMSVSGIGEVKADAILEYRKKHSCFKNVEELKEVKGFGEGFLEKNKKNIKTSDCKKK